MRYENGRQQAGFVDDIEREVGGDFADVTLGVNRGSPHNRKSYREQFCIYKNGESYWSLGSPPNRTLKEYEILKRR